VSRTNAQSLRALDDEAIERICVNAYPLLVSDAYESLLGARAIDPFMRRRKPTAVANAEGASLVCRAAWLRMNAPEIHVRTVPCNDYHVCTLLDAELQPFASIGTRSAGSAPQELVLLAPGGTAATTRGAFGLRSPSEVIVVLTHHVRLSRESFAGDTSPFHVEDQHGSPLLDLDGPAEAVDALAHLEAMRPEQYFSDALNVLHETVTVRAQSAIKAGVQKCFARIAAADRAGAASKGWTMLDHRGRDRSPECRAAAVHAGYLCAYQHDVLEFVTRCDSHHVPLDGARTYSVRFERWNEPPSHAEWFLYVTPAKPVHVDLVRSEPAMTITLGPSPPKDAENWIETLPREEPLEVRLILCWPSERARSEIWTPPEIVALNGS
jgi:hypothetical protein